MILRVNQVVDTPNGPGTIQGRMVENGKTLLLVSHNPKDPAVNESIKEQFLKRIWVLRTYEPDQLTPR